MPPVCLYRKGTIMAYEIEEAKRIVVEAGKKLVESGLIARTWGNVSARISDTQFVITPSGRAYEDLTPEEIVVVNIDDCSYEGDIKPSSEKGVHAAAYRHHPTVDFVIHIILLFHLRKLFLLPHNRSDIPA